MNKFTFPLLLSLGVVLLGSCSKDNAPGGNPPVTGVGTTQMKFENYVGNELLVMNSVGLPASAYPYVNANGDSFNVSLYKYYVTNIRFIKSGGGEYAEPESYHLINQAEPSSFSFNIGDIPEGSYTSVKVLLGVDSTRNVSGAQTGDLDPLKDMFWTWNSGYIMAKIEGKSATSDKPDKSIVFHLGGFSGVYSVLREVTLPFPQDLVVKKGVTNVITFKSDLLKWFTAPNLIDFAMVNNVMNPGKTAYDLSMNYRNSLSVTKVEN